MVTGEGTFDWQSLRGKVVAAVAAAGLEVGTPVVVVAGQVLVGRREALAIGVESAYAVAEDPAGGPGGAGRPGRHPGRAGRAGRPYLVPPPVTRDARVPFWRTHARRGDVRWRECGRQRRR